MKKIINVIDAYGSYFVFAFLVSVSFFSFFYFFQNGQNLLYGEALSRMDISRKIIDNLTPGLAQIGNVWPPFSQILFLPFVKFDFLWRTGLAGWLVSGLAYIGAAYFIFKTIKIITVNSFVSFIGALSFLLNINILYK